MLLSTCLVPSFVLRDVVVTRAACIAQSDYTCMEIDGCRRHTDAAKISLSIFNLFIIARISALHPTSPLQDSIDILLSLKSHNHIVHSRLIFVFSIHLTFPPLLQTEHEWRYNSYHGSQAPSTSYLHAWTSKHPHPIPSRLLSSIPSKHRSLLLITSTSPTTNQSANLLSTSATSRKE